MVINEEELRLRGIDVDAIAEKFDIDTFCWRAERAFWQPLDGTDHIEDAANYLGIELVRKEP